MSVGSQISVPNLPTWGRQTTRSSTWQTTHSSIQAHTTVRSGKNTRDGRHGDDEPTIRRDRTNGFRPPVFTLDS